MGCLPAHLMFAVPASRSGGVGAVVPPRQSPIRIKAAAGREASVAPDAFRVPETDRYDERVSNWKVHRTRGSPEGMCSHAPPRRPTPGGSRARREDHSANFPGRCGLQSQPVVVSQPQCGLTAPAKVQTNILFGSNSVRSRSTKNDARASLCAIALVATIVFVFAAFLS